MPYNSIITDMISYHIQRLRDYGRTPLWSALPSTNHCITDYHTFSNLKQHLYIISQFRKKRRWISWFLCSWAHNVKIKMLAKLVSIRGFGKKFASKLIQVLAEFIFSHMTESPNSLQVISWRPPADPRSHTRFLPTFVCLIKPTRRISCSSLLKWILI